MPSQNTSLETEQMLDRIYHALPEWVHHSFPNDTLDMKVIRALAHVQETWTQNFMREVQDHAKTKEFLVWLCKKHGHTFENNYWNFLISKDLLKATEEETRVLTKMQKPV
jgi:hypothetical protein